MTLLLHPLLMIVGLIAGMAILRVAGWFMGLFMFDAMQDMNSGGINITSLFGMLAMWAITMIVVTYKCMSLTYELPDHVLKWMGVGSQFSDLGEREGQHQTLAIGGAVGGGLHKTTGDGLANVKDRQNDRRKAEKDAMTASKNPVGNNPVDVAAPGGGVKTKEM
jgi:hypothetical protein